MLNEESEREWVGPDRRRVDDRRATIVERRRGRRRLGETTTQISIRMPTDLLDRVCRVALRRRTSVSEAHRALLEVGLEADENVYPKNR
jgi:hypothetical protein